MTSPIRSRTVTIDLVQAMFVCVLWQGLLNYDIVDQQLRRVANHDSRAFEAVWVMWTVHFHEVCAPTSPAYNPFGLIGQHVIATGEYFLLATLLPLHLNLKGLVCRVASNGGCYESCAAHDGGEPGGHISPVDIHRPDGG